MIKVNNQDMDVVLHVEEHTTIKQVFDKLTLEVDGILIICPRLFIERFIHAVYDDLDEFTVFALGKQLESNESFIKLHLFYKNKGFTFNFILLDSQTKVINNPFKGEQSFNIGFKEIKTE